MWQRYITFCNFTRKSKIDQERKNHYPLYYTKSKLINIFEKKREDEKEIAEVEVPGKYQKRREPKNEQPGPVCFQSIQENSIIP